MAAPTISEGLASGRSTLQITWKGLAPIESDASISPLSTSRSEDSTIRAINGAAAITSGTMVALEPMVVPVMKRVIGITAISRIKNGMERVILTIMSKILWTMGRGLTPSLSQATKITPIGIPST